MAKRSVIAVPLTLVLLLGGIVAVLPRHRSNESEPAPPSTPAAKSPPTPNRPATAPSFDWPKIAAGMQEPHPDGQIPDDSIYGQFLKSVHEMDAQALLAAWDSLQAARLSPTERRRLQSTLVEALLKKDPELALNRFAKHAGDLSDPMASQLFGGFRRWTVTSPSKAAFWLDQNIAAGNFSDPQATDPAATAKIRLNYERELIRIMIGLGQDQAAIRMETVPPALRADVLKGMDPARNQAIYALLIRKYLHSNEQEQEFIRMAKTAAYEGGKPAVATLLDLIHASSQERERILRSTADFNPGPSRKEERPPSD